jgi:hypothetical protein
MSNKNNHATKTQHTKLTQSKSHKKVHAIDHKNPITFITCKKTNKSKNNNPFFSFDHHQLPKVLSYYAFGS